MATTRYDTSDYRYQLAILAKERAEREQNLKEGVGHTVKAGTNLFKAWSNEQNIMMKEKIATGDYELNPEYADSNFFKRMFTPWEDRVKEVKAQKPTTDPEVVVEEASQAAIDPTGTGMLDNQTDVTAELFSETSNPVISGPFADSNYGQGTIESVDNIGPDSFIPGQSMTQQDLVNQKAALYESSLDPLTNVPAGSEEFFNLRQNYTPDQLIMQRTIEDSELFSNVDPSNTGQYGLQLGPEGTIDPNLPSLDEFYQGSPALTEDLKAVGGGQTFDEILAGLDKKVSDAYRANYESKLVSQSGLSLEDLEQGETLAWDTACDTPGSTVELSDAAQDLIQDSPSVSTETAIDIYNLNLELPRVKDGKLVSRELGGRIDKKAALGITEPGDLIVNPNADPLSLNNQFMIKDEIGAQFKPGGKFYSEASSLKETAQNVSKEGAVIPGVKLADPGNTYTKTEEFSKILDGQSVAKKTAETTAKEAGKGTLGKVVGGAGLALSTVDAAKNWDRMSGKKRVAKIAEIGASAAAMAGLINPLWGVGLALGSGLLD